MQIECKVSPRITVKVEGVDVKGAFAALAEAQEVFGHEKCGKCGCDSIVFSHRVIDENSYYSLRCGDDKCRAQLDFGQLRSGEGLFVKRKDKAGNWIANGGWYVFRKDSSPSDEPFA